MLCLIIWEMKPFLSSYEDCSHYHYHDIQIMVEKCQTSSHCIDFVWLANACKLVNPYLAFTVIKAIAPQQSWFIADYGMHCFMLVRPLMKIMLNIFVLKVANRL